MKNERIGRPETIPFQLADGSVERRCMHPVLDEMGNVSRWVDLAAAIAHQAARGLR